MLTLKQPLLSVFNSILEGKSVVDAVNPVNALCILANSNEELHKLLNQAVSYGAWTIVAAILNLNRILPTKQQLNSILKHSPTTLHGQFSLIECCPKDSLHYIGTNVELCEYISDPKIFGKMPGHHINTYYLSSLPELVPYYMKLVSANPRFAGSLNPSDLAQQLILNLKAPKELQLTINQNPPLELHLSSVSDRNSYLYTSLLKHFKSEDLLFLLDQEILIFDRHLALSLCREGRHDFFNLLPREHLISKEFLVLFVNAPSLRFYDFLQHFPFPKFTAEQVLDCFSTKAREISTAVFAKWYSLIDPTIRKVILPKALELTTTKHTYPLVSLLPYLCSSDNSFEERALPFLVDLIDNNTPLEADLCAKLITPLISLWETNSSTATLTSLHSIFQSNPLKQYLRVVKSHSHSKEHFDLLGKLPTRANLHFAIRHNYSHSIPFLLSSLKYKSFEQPIKWALEAVAPDVLLHIRPFISPDKQANLDILYATVKASFQLKQHRESKKQYCIS